MRALTPGRHADTYDWCGPLIADLVRARHDPASAEVLDVGPCWGKYRILLPGYQMDACEAWEPYVRDEDLASMYRAVFTADICDHVESGLWHPYDLVIMGDVFEHIARDRAAPMLDKVLDTCGDVIIAVPYLYEQGPEHGNPWQRHLQDDLTQELMAAEYPRLRLTHTEFRDGRPFKGIYRPASLG